MATSPAAAPSAIAHDLARARVLRAFLAAGLLFMLVPGTLLGVMNLIQISGRDGAALVPDAWIQAHGHAQVFGWIGTFMLGIGLYAVPAATDRRTGFGHVWTIFALWTLGVALRWSANVQGWQWRTLLPVSAVLELAAFALFVRAMASHRHHATSPGASRIWMAGVFTGTAGWVVALSINAVVAVLLARRAATPAIPHGIDQHLLTLLAWGVFAPFIWGFSARWLPVLLGVDPPRTPWFAAAIVAVATGVALTYVGAGAVATPVFVLASVCAVVALRLFEPAPRAARTRGVDTHFPLFVRLAYAWLVIAAVLGVAAARWDTSGGIWGASRHAFTVGFTSAMVFLVGQRMLPGFAGHKVLWSSRLMFLGLVLLMAGCTLRVSAEVLAYQHLAAWAWAVLPVSAVIELTAIVAFAANMYRTLWW